MTHKWIVEKNGQYAADDSPQPQWTTNINEAFVFTDFYASIMAFSHEWLDKWGRGARVVYVEVQVVKL